MSDTIAMIGASMRADADALRIIAQNIANAEVTAYRRQVPVNTLQFDQIAGSQALDSPDAPGRMPGGEVAIDARPGTLKATGRPLDLAIEGSGFFVLQSAGGLLLTRRGDFHVSPDGLLAAASGDAVLGNTGPIHIGTGRPDIEADGIVRIGTDVVDQLQVLHFSNEAALQYLGNGLYVNANDVPVNGEGYSTVRQGFLETSNVAPVGEMVQLMETMRHFEAAQRLVRGYDQMMEKAISELGRVD